MPPPRADAPRPSRCTPGPLPARRGAIVLPGASHSGKTTITTALAAAGHRFVADEVSRLDPDRLTITPYGKPVALRSASVELLSPTIARLRRGGSRFEIDERFVPPSELGPTATGGAPGSNGGIAAEPVEVAAIVFPRFDANGPHRFAPLGPAETLERLVQCTLGDISTPVGVDVFRILERLVPRRARSRTRLHRPPRRARRTRPADGRRSLASADSLSRHDCCGCSREVRPLGRP